MDIAGFINHTPAKQGCTWKTDHNTHTFRITTLTVAFGVETIVGMEQKVLWAISRRRVAPESLVLSLRPGTAAHRRCHPIFLGDDLRVINSNTSPKHKKDDVKGVNNTFYWAKRKKLPCHQSLSGAPLTPCLVSVTERTAQERRPP